MKKCLKNVLKFTFLWLLCFFCVPNVADKASAATRRVMTLTVKSSIQKVTVPIYAEEDWYGYNFRVKKGKENINLAVASEKDTIRVSVAANDKKMIVAKSLPKTAKLTEKSFANSQKKNISFQYMEDDQTYQGSFSYQVTVHKLERKLDSCYVSTSAQGFWPSQDNYLPIQTNFTVNSSNMTGATLRIRILNARGKYVYQKSYTKLTQGGFLRLLWDGKASRNNEAGVKANTYVKAGTYKVEFALICPEKKYASYFKPVVRKKTIKISSKAAAGVSGVASAREIPRLTGNKNVDYMAEQMIKAAGITSNMSQEQKVRSIYHYMTYYFTHVHYGSGTTNKVYYDTSRLKSKINAYRKETDELNKKDKLLYSYNPNAPWEEWNMARRIGVCDDHANIFVILCNHVGIDAGVCRGYYKNLNGTKAGHAWNYAIVDGTKYYYDVDVEIQNRGKGQGDYYWYKKTRSQSEKNHEFVGC